MSSKVHFEAESGKATLGNKPHRWVLKSKALPSRSYNQFLNWLRVEFSFFQQVEKKEGLLIHFPNGFVALKSFEPVKNTRPFQFEVHSSCKKMGQKMNERVTSFLNSVAHYHNCNTA